MNRYTSSIACVILLTAISFSGSAKAGTGIVVASSDKSDRATIRAYEKKMQSLVKAIQSNSNYVRIPLDTKKEQEWFNQHAFNLFDQQISKEQFVEQGLSLYPGYRETFEYLADMIAD